MKISNSHLLTGLMIGMVMLFIACGADEKKPDEVDTTDKKPTISVPKFSGDSAYSYVVAQLDFGPRNPGSKGHTACKEWLAQKLGEWADTVILQDFTAKTWDNKNLASTNIMAMFNPNAKHRILLAAHWDTRAVAEEDSDPAMQNKPILGADDGASGVAVLLEIARQLALNPIETGVDIVLFDAEDQGRSGANDMESWCLGSQYWSRNLISRDYSPEFGILLDMVGSKSPRFTKEAISMNFAPNVMNRVWQIAANAGFGGYFVNEKSGPITDDHYFVNTIAKIPMINIINRPVNTTTGFGDYWHTHNDNIDVIEKRSLHATGQVLLHVLYKVEDGSF
jgi:glutaminyl-peptide cyclotransferase